MDRFVAGFERLSERARARLAIENDDRSFELVDVLTLAGGARCRSSGMSSTTAASIRAASPTTRRCGWRSTPGRP
jgi:UV-endonuclease UvdE